MLGTSLTLAVSFASYGLLRKLAPVNSLPGLTIESLILLLPASAILYWHTKTMGGLSFGEGTLPDVLLASARVVTAAPLLLFAAAARRMEYSKLGFVQYLAPTIVFLLGLTVFEEPLRPVQLACFICIWAAIAIYSADLINRQRRKPKPS